MAVAQRTSVVGARGLVTAWSASSMLRRALMATAAVAPVAGGLRRGRAPWDLRSCRRRRYGRPSLLGLSRPRSSRRRGTAAQPAGDVVAELPADVEEERVAVERLPVIQAKASEAAAIVALQRDDGRLDDRDVERLHTRELIRIEAVRTVGGQDDIVGPLAQQDGEVFAASAFGEDGEPLVPVLEAVAVRTGVRSDPPYLGKARNVGHPVEHARGQEHRPRQSSRRRTPVPRRPGSPAARSRAARRRGLPGRSAWRRRTPRRWRAGW